MLALVEQVMVTLKPSKERLGRAHKLIGILVDGFLAKDKHHAFAYFPRPFPDNGFAPGDVFSVPLQELFDELKCDALRLHPFDIPQTPVFIVWLRIAFIEFVEILQLFL
jgi:hypothetical protein